MGRWGQGQDLRKHRTCSQLFPYCSYLLRLPSAPPPAFPVVFVETVFTCLIYPVGKHWIFLSSLSPSNTISLSVLQNLIASWLPLQPSAACQLLPVLARLTLNWPFSHYCLPAVFCSFSVVNLQDRSECATPLSKISVIYIER